MNSTKTMISAALSALIALLTSCSCPQSVTLTLRDQPGEILEPLQVNKDGNFVSAVDDPPEVFYVGPFIFEKSISQTGSVAHYAGEKIFFMDFSDKPSSISDFNWKQYKEYTLDPRNEAKLFYIGIDSKDCNNFLFSNLQATLFYAEKWNLNCCLWFQTSQKSNDIYLMFSGSKTKKNSNKIHLNSDCIIAVDQQVFSSMKQCLEYLNSNLRYKEIFISRKLLTNRELFDILGAIGRCRDKGSVFFF